MHSPHLHHHPLRHPAPCRGQRQRRHGLESLCCLLVWGAVWVQHDDGGGLRQGNPAATSELSADPWLPPPSDCRCCALALLQHESCGGSNRAESVTGAAHIAATNETTHGRTWRQPSQLCCQGLHQLPLTIAAETCERLASLYVEPERTCTLSAEPRTASATTGSIVALLSGASMTTALRLGRQQQEQVALLGLKAASWQLAWQRLLHACMLAGWQWYAGPCMLWWAVAAPVDDVVGKGGAHVAVSQHHYVCACVHATWRYPICMLLVRLHCWQVPHACEAQGAVGLYLKILYGSWWAAATWRKRAGTPWFQPRTRM